MSSVIQTLISSVKSHASPLSIAALLGTSVDVKIRLKNVKDDDLTKVDAALKSAIISYYTTVVLMSRTPVPAHVSVCSLKISLPTLTRLV